MKFGVSSIMELRLKDLRECGLASTDTPIGEIQGAKPTYPLCRPNYSDCSYLKHPVTAPMPFSNNRYGHSWVRQLALLFSVFIPTFRNKKINNQSLVLYLITHMNALLIRHNNRSMQTINLTVVMELPVD